MGPFESMGFTGENVREKLDTFETLVSNSAVEVGVDFDTEQIIFSGHDAASFFQRLGRLRTRPNRSAAYAYVPPYLLDALNSMANKYTGQWIDRATFEEYVSSGYIDASTPDHSTGDTRLSKPTITSKNEQRVHHQMISQQYGRQAGNALNVTSSTTTRRNLLRLI